MNDAQLATLAAELTTSTHPSTPTYNADAQLAADELNALNIASENTIQVMFDYMFNKKHQTGQGTDTVYTPILGRLLHAAESAAGSDPFGRGAGNELNLQQIHACKAMKLVFETMHVSDLDYSDSNLPLGYLNGAGVISVAQRNALEALSDNLQSQATVLGLPVVRANDVLEARG